MSTKAVVIYVPECDDCGFVCECDDKDTSKQAMYNSHHDSGDWWVNLEKNKAYCDDCAPAHKCYYCEEFDYDKAIRYCDGCDENICDKCWDNHMKEEHDE